MEYGPEYPIPVVTSDDVRVIARYVDTGKLLPLTAGDVKKELKDAPDTLITDIVTHYKIINKHALSWEKTQQSMIVVSNALVGFSKDLHQYGDDAVKIIKNMENYQSMKIGDLTEDDLSALPAISLNGGDELKIETLQKTIDYIKESIKEKKLKTSAALTELDTFKRTLINEIQPWVGQMIQISNPDTLDTEISNIHRELNRLATDIKQTHTKPSASMDLLEFSPLIRIARAATEEMKASGKTGGELIKRREEAISKLAVDNKLKGVLQILKVGMGSLYDVVNPAIIATMQLHSHWENILLLIDQSSNQFKTNANYAFLGMFVRRMEALLRNWSSIQENSDALKDAFRLENR